MKRTENIDVVYFLSSILLLCHNQFQMLAQWPVLIQDFFTYRVASMEVLIVLHTTQTLFVTEEVCKEILFF